MHEGDIQNVMDIVEALEKILRFTVSITSAEEFMANELVFDAVLMNFVSVGESANRLSKDVQKNYPSIPWRKIKGLRNIIAHDYFGIDAEEIWQIIEKDIPKALLSFKKILADN